MLRPDKEDFFIDVLDECRDSDYTQLIRTLNAYPYYENKQIKSLIMSQYQSMYYVDIQPQHYQWMINILKPKVKYAFLIYFRENVLNRFLQDVKIEPRERIDYHVMRLEKEDFKPQLLTEYSKTHMFSPMKPNTFECRCLTVDDFDKFWTLQKKYHLEEVYSNNAFYPEEVEQKNFMLILETYINYGILLNGEPVAKSNVNSTSKNIYQIGGIITDESLRNKALMQHCLSEMITQCFKHVNTVSLYVRQSNKAAIKVYQKLGFKIAYNSAIIYIN